LAFAGVTGADGFSALAATTFSRLIGFSIKTGFFAAATEGTVALVLGADGLPPPLDVDLALVATGLAAGLAMGAAAFLVSGFEAGFVVAFADFPAMGFDLTAALLFAAAVVTGAALPLAAVFVAGFGLVAALTCGLAAAPLLTFAETLTFATGFAADFAFPALAPARGATAALPVFALAAATVFLPVDGFVAGLTFADAAAVLPTLLTLALDFD
jgi:hypothetical protein